MSLIRVVYLAFIKSLCSWNTRGFAFFSAAALLCGALAVPAPSYAGDVAPYFAKNEFNGDPRDTCSGTTNPIDIRSLNKYHEIPIFRGKGEFPLEFSVFHNTRNHSEIDGYKIVHGKWTFSYGQRLHFLPNNEIEMVRPDGRSIFFKKVGSQYQGIVIGVNVGTAAAGELSSLSVGKYQYKRLDGVVEYFDSQGRLQKLAHRSGAEQSVVRASGLWGAPEKLTVTHSNTSQTIEIHYGIAKSVYGDGTVVANFRAQESLVDFVSPSGEKTQFGSRTQRYYIDPFVEAPEIYSAGTYTISQSIPDTIAPPGGYYSDGMAPADFHLGVYLPTLSYISWPNGERTHFFYASYGSSCIYCRGPVDFKYPKKFWAVETSLVGVADVGTDNIVRYTARYPFKTINYYGYDVASVNSIHGKNDVSLNDQVYVNTGHQRTWKNVSGYTKVFSVNKVGPDVRITYANGAAFPGGGCFTSESQQISFDSLGRRDIVTVNGKSVDYDYYTDGNFSTVGLLDKVTYLSADKISGALVDRVVDYDWTSMSPGDERLLKRVVAPGRIKEFEYEFGRIRKEVHTDTSSDPIGYARMHGRVRQWEHTYTYHDSDADGRHRVATVESIGPGGERWAYMYNETGDLVSLTNGLGHTVTFSGHNEFGFPTIMADSNGVVSTLNYDTRGRLTRISTEGHSTSLDYQADGKLAKVTFGDYTYLQYEYSDGGRLTAVRSGGGERVEIERTRDISGFEDITTMIYGATGTLRAQMAARYTALGQLWKMYDLGGVAAGAVLKEIVYDADGYPKEVNDAAGTVQHLFDNLGRLEKTTDQRDRNSVVSIGYDAQDNISVVRDPKGVKTVYHYDGFGNLLQESNPNTGTTTYYYDDAGNVIEKVAANAKQITYTYDELNRLRTINYPTQADVTFEYDATLTRGSNNYGIGRMTGAYTTDGRKLNWIYDRFGNVVRDIRTIGGKTYKTSYSYDATNKLTTIGYPSGRKVILVRSDGRITEVKVKLTGISLAGNITYEPFGPVIAFTYFNGINFTESLDGHYRSDTLSAGNILDLDYGYDNRGLVDSVVDLAGGPRGQNIQYDGAARLTQGSGDYGTYSYSYDRVGNRTALTWQRGDSNYSESYTYKTGTHRLTGISGNGAGAQNRTMSYSPVGSLRTDTGRTLNYNDSGRLITVRVDNTVIGRYGYNPLGERDSKTAGGKTRHFVYGRNGELLYEGAADQSWYREYIYLEGRLIAIAGDGGVDDPSQYHAVHTDRLGTPQVVTDNSSSVVWSAVYEPFGKVRLLAAAFENNIRFPGQYYDQETGLHYNYFRDYDPSTGRYIESDPIGLRGGFNTYRYGNANPLLYLDFSGLDAEVGVRKFYPAPVPYARHCFVRFNGNNNDTLSFDNTGVHADPNPGSADYSPTTGTQNDSCVRQEMQRCRAEDYDFTQYNCCQCVSNALNACNLQKNGPWPNSPFDASRPPYTPPAPPQGFPSGDTVAP